MNRKKTDKRTLQKRLEYLFLQCAVRPLMALPYRTRERALHLLTRCVAFLSPDFRARVHGNLARALPDLSLAERNALARENVFNLARMTNEFLGEPHMTPDFIERMIVYEPDMETVRRLLNRGGMLVLGHQGSWEFMGVGITHLCESAELHVFAKRQKNPWANEWIARMRATQNIKLIYTDESPRVALSLLKKKHLVAFIADQDAGSTGEFFPFFGRLASTFQGPAMFARMTDCPILFCWSWHDSESRLHFQLMELPRPTLDSKSDPAAWEREFTYKWVQLLESKVREHPGDYYWLHRRWHTRPKRPEELNAYWLSRGAKLNEPEAG
jgi:Kdo2-lipid IVA lauroyltransferase/acyltransferase